MVIKDIIGMVFIALAILLYIIEVIGVFRFKYVLNRMHAVAIGDSLALFLALMGAAILLWNVFDFLKLLAVVCFMWITGPVSSHLLARVEAMTNNHLESYLDVPINEVGHTLKGDPYDTNDNN